MRPFLLAAGLVGACCVTTSACLMEASDCTFDGTCAVPSGPDGSASSSGGGDGGLTDADAGEPAIPVGCDVNADAKDSLPCAVTSFALFVNGEAPEGGDGSKEKPFRAIQKAIDSVSATGKRRIYVCGNAIYAEHLEMKAGTSARVLGGFECVGWTPVEQKPRVAPADAGYALHIDSVPSEVRVEDISLEAVAGTPTSRSSIAVFVANSPNVRFLRAEIKANMGAPGSDGSMGKLGVSTPLDLSGRAGTNTAGGAAWTCTCDTGGTSVGGSGGNINEPPLDGQRGLPIIDLPIPAGATGEGQSIASCNGSGSSAKDGSTGKDGRSAPKAVVGLLDASGWSPGNGGNGENGSPGQGGGGGGGRNNSGPAQNGGGGGGGCGGCGGGGGGGGTAGGSSVAILSHDSRVSLVGCRVIVSDGGAGGAGKGGSAGAFGGGRGFPGGALACFGGGGGTGGAGGGGAGGAGGNSLGILYSGPAPDLTNGTNIVHGLKGSGGLGGSPTVNDGPDGFEGDSSAVQ